MSEIHARQREKLASQRAREVPTTDVVGFTVESKKPIGYPSHPSNCLVFIDGKFAIGEWLVGDE